MRNSEECNFLPEFGLPVVQVIYAIWAPCGALVEFKVRRDKIWRQKNDFSRRGTLL